jgi:hypothetical protein
MSVISPCVRQDTVVIQPYSDFQLEELFPAAIFYFQLVRKLQILHHSVAHAYRFKVTKGLPLVPRGYFYFLAIKKLVVG